MQKQSNEDFFVQLLNAWIDLANNNLPTLTSVEEILDQPIFLNPHTKLDFSSGNPYFYCIPPRNILDNFTEKRGVCRFLQLLLISFTTFDKKVGFATANHKRIYKLMTDFYWKNFL